ncbi:hypothetical protein TNCV_611581 [Trichonephila clavipes]|nr:hypothetical protein TNCV_611581 [Trichonephila clavipes]
MTPCGRPCHSLCICAVNSPVSRRLQLPSQRVQTCPNWRKIQSWQAMVGRHILEDIVGRVAQYVTSIILLINGTWATDSMGSTIGVKISSTDLRAVKVPEGPRKMIVCPKKLLPTPSHLVKLLYAARQ